MKTKTVISILVLWLCFSTHYTKRIMTPEYVVLRGWLKARWYSPFFWVYAVAMLVKFILVGGLLSWILWVEGQLNQATFEKDFYAGWNEPTLTKWAMFKLEYITMYLLSKYSFA